MRRRQRQPLSHRMREADSLDRAGNHGDAEGFKGGEALTLPPVRCRDCGHGEERGREFRCLKRMMSISDPDKIRRCSDAIPKNQATLDWFPVGVEP